MGIVLVAVGVCCSAMDLQKAVVWRCLQGKHLWLFLFQQGLGWFWEVFVFVLKRNVVIVPNHGLFGNGFLRAPILHL